MNKDTEETFEDEWYDQKTELMVSVLGKEYDSVMHALIPYEIGGTLDLYYFLEDLPGTAIATKELTPGPEEGPSNDFCDHYELVMWTRHPIDLESANDESTPFGKAHRSINAILNCIAPYSEQATLNPNETCEFPEDMEFLGGKCLIFDMYGSEKLSDEFGLLAIIEIHRSEMEFAREHGGSKLIDRLKQKGYYPYSDLDRPPVA